MAYTRITALWNGATGLPGYSRFKFVGDLDSGACAAAAARLRTFFNNFASILPATVNVTFVEAAQIYDIEGQLTGEVAFTPPALVQGSGSGAFAGPVGAVVNWTTSTISGGRKLRGRTFLVPLVGSAFSSSGAPSSAALLQINNAATALAAGTPALAIHSAKETSWVLGSVTGGSAPARAAVLRSRRD